MQKRLQCLTVWLLLFTAACGAREDGVPPREPGDPAPPVTTPPTPPADTAQPAPQQRPPTREDTVVVEGTPVVETSTLVTAPAGFVIPFSTYVPRGMEADIDAPSTARFTAAFGGTVNEDAYMEVYVHPTGAARPSAADLVADLMRTRSAAEHETVASDRPAWALDATGFRYIGADGANITGSVSVGQHGSAYFHVVRHYPVEYGDGLPPRLHTILRLWRWEDTGDMLMR